MEDLFAQARDGILACPVGIEIDDVGKAVREGAEEAALLRGAERQVAVLAQHGVDLDRRQQARDAAETRRRRNLGHRRVGAVDVGYPDEGRAAGPSRGHELRLGRGCAERESGGSDRTCEQLHRRNSCLARLQELSALLLACPR